MAFIQVTYLENEGFNAEIDTDIKRNLRCIKLCQLAYYLRIHTI